MTFGPRYQKSAGTYQKPAGFYKAIVTRVESNQVYVKVPRLSYEFEHGPIPYAGDAPLPGDETYVGFLEGRQDDVVAIFPGNRNESAFAGPIEVTYLVVGSDARQALKDVADWVCDGTADETQIQLALTAVGTTPGRVVCEGTFNISDGAVLNMSNNTVLQGSGAHLTTFVSSSVATFEINMADDCDIDGIGFIYTST